MRPGSGIVVRYLIEKMSRYAYKPNPYPLAPNPFIEVIDKKITIIKYGQGNI